MGSHIICIVFIVAVQFSAGLGRNHNYEYYISKYHHKSSTALSSSIAGFSPDVTTESPVSDDSLENIKHSSTGDNSVENIKLSAAADSEDTHHRNRTGHSNEYGDRFVSDSDTTPYPGVTIAIIVGCTFLCLAVCSCCIFICFRICRRRNAIRRGFVIADRAPIPPPVVHPHQPITSPTASQPPVVGHQYPPQQYHNQQPQSNPAPSQYQEERPLLLPPQYQPQTMQQPYQPDQNHYQSQCSPAAPMDHNHNPPEAPPPYDFPEKF